MDSSRLKARLARARAEALKPPPKLNLIEWADTHRVIARQNSANPGPWKTWRVPIAYGPMRAVTDPDTQVITLMACTQIVKSELLLNVAGYFIHQDPASILFVQPTQKLAESFSKERFAPTREATPVLRVLIPEPKSRDSGVTITHKEYPGGTLDFVGANSPVDLASRPKRVTLADEIDLYPADAGGMGDPLALAEERSSTFKRRRLNVRTCSPSDESTSRIWREYQASDQRKCFVGCPHCGHDQVLRWSETTVLWDRDADGNHLPYTARYHCEACGVGWSEAERIAALRALSSRPDHGWRQTRTFQCCGEDRIPSQWDARGRALCSACGRRAPYDGHAGFHVSKLYSTRHELADIVREWLGSRRNPEKLRKFVNTALAEVWREDVETISVRGLTERVEAYDHRSAPEAVRLVTFGTDVQADRLETTFVGYGDDEEKWVLRHVVLHGDTAARDVWDALDALVREPVLTGDGRSLVPQAGCVDSGYRGEMVHAFCRSRLRRRIYATRGTGNGWNERKRIWPGTPSRTKNSRDRVYLVGVDTAKDHLAATLRLTTAEGEPTPNAIHFPQDGLPADYFEQLTAEQAVTERSGDATRRTWAKKVPDARNEALDCFVLAMAARRALPARLDRRAGSDRRTLRRERPVKAPATEAAAPVPMPAPVAAAALQSDADRRAERRRMWARR